MNQRTLGRTGLTVSLLGLGTVEIGLSYGIGVKNLPTEQGAERVLKTAIELGITYVDTARGYGVAEERIGKSGIGKLAGLVIGTKCAQFLEKGEDPRGAELEKRIRVDIEASRRMLSADSLQLVQIHGGTKEQIERGELIEIMQKLVDEGKVQHVGISPRGEAAALAALESNFFETIQLAYSILDQRMHARVLPLAREKNVGIISRSVLLKGALTPAHQKLPEQLTPLKRHAALAAGLATHLGMELPMLAMRFVISNPAVSTTLIGTAHVAELKTALAAIVQGPLSPSILTKLYTLAIDDPTQIDPAQWPPLK